jgi:DNA-binding transcriptional regulator GbsR (MarR family)
MKLLKTLDYELTEIEHGLIELFVNASRVLGLPKSVGEIYGLVYASSVPLTMDDIMTRLGMSLGSTSQGLKMLRSFGAVNTVYVKGTRKDLYVAELDFRKIITQYLSEVLLPQFSNSKLQLEELNRLVNDSRDQSLDRELTKKIKVLSKVSKKANLLLPAISKILTL